MEQMKKLSKKIVLLLTCVMLVATGLLLTGCDNTVNPNPDGSENGGVTGENTTYTISVKSVGGMPMEGLDIYIFADNTLADLKQAGKTDANGIVNFSLPTSENYAFTIAGAPKGYEVSPSYSFSNGTSIVTLNTSLITDEDITAAKLSVGDVMYDFTVTTIDGKEIKLSDLLKEKKMVMLNFWYTTCSWCITEFPIMSEVYEQYKDEIEIVAINPSYPTDSLQGVQNFQNTYQLPFPVAWGSSAWAQTFGIQGYPTSVFIDQYGVICLIEAGAITSNSPFISAFEHFTADDYQQKLCASVSELVEVVGL